jgi:hypothetical protein
VKEIVGVVEREDVQLAALFRQTPEQACVGLNDEYAEDGYEKVRAADQSVHQT